MPQVVIDSLNRQQLWMTSRLGHATSLQHKYPGVGFNICKICVMQHIMKRRVYVFQAHWGEGNFFRPCHLSDSMIVESLCAMVMEVRPCWATSRASWTTCWSWIWGWWGRRWWGRWWWWWGRLWWDWATLGPSCNLSSEEHLDDLWSWTLCKLKDWGRVFTETEQKK